MELAEALSAGVITQAEFESVANLDTGGGEDMMGYTEFALLEMLIANPRRVLTRSRILEEVWGFDFPTSGNALEVYVGYLRRKTEAEGEPRLIHTVRGVGYVLRETPP